MKKLVYLFSLLAIASVVVITGCKKDEEAVPPSISFLTPGLTADASMDPNVAFTIITSSVKGDKNLKSLNVTVNNGPITGYPKDISGGSYTDTLSSITNPNPGTYNYTFTVTDKNDKTASGTITITVTSSTPFTQLLTGQFYHRQGLSRGAYDLVNKLEMSSTDTDANKDMENTDAAGVTFTGSWSAGAGNTTMYVKDNTYDYVNATEESAASAYNAGTASATVSNPAASDIYIANLRNGNYAVIQISAVEPADNTCGCTNKGKISFGYQM